MLLPSAESDDGTFLLGDAIEMGTDPVKNGQYRPPEMATDEIVVFDLSDDELGEFGISSEPAGVLLTAAEAPAVRNRQRPPLPEPQSGRKRLKSHGVASSPVWRIPGGSCTKVICRSIAGLSAFEHSLAPNSVGRVAGPTTLGSGARGRLHSTEVRHAKK